MKRPLFLMAISAVALGMVLASGCSKLFRSHKAWESAQQESPLEIPPGLDRPSTSEALVIPPPGSGQAAPDEGHSAAAGNGEVSDGFVLKDAVDSTYQRVGRVLEHGDLGQVVGHDDEAHSYTVNAAALVAAQKKPGLFKRLFHRGKSQAQEASPAVSKQVVVTVAANGSNGSEVRAQGGAAAVGKIVEGLKSALGG